MKTTEQLALEVARDMGYEEVSHIEQINFARRLMDKIAEQSEPVAWMQSNHLHTLKMHHTGSAMMLARCSDHKAMDDFVPLYLHPKPDTEIEALRIKAVIADMPMSEVEGMLKDKLTRYRAVMEQAVEALEDWAPTFRIAINKRDEALTAIRSLLGEENE